VSGRRWGLTVGLRRGDGEREGNGLGKKNGFIEWTEMVWKNDGERRLAEDGERRWRVVRGGRRWRVVRGGRRWKDFGVDGEREGKFEGKLGGTKMRK